MKDLTFCSNCPYSVHQSQVNIIIFLMKLASLFFKKIQMKIYSSVHLYPKLFCPLKCPSCMHKVGETSPHWVHHLVLFSASCALQGIKSDFVCSISSGHQSYSNELICSKASVRKTSSLYLCSSCIFSLE